MPQIRFQDGATLRDISDIRFQDGGTLRTIQKAYYQDGGTLRLVWERNTYVALTITSQPRSMTQTHSPSRNFNEAINITTSMTTAGGAIHSISYTIANLSGDTGAISVSVFGSGTHNASISGTGTRTRFDNTTYSVTFRVKATDGTSTVYSNFVTLTDKVGL